MARVDPQRFAKAVTRLQADADWNIVLEHIEHQYETLKDRLVTCADADQTGLKGEARVLRRLLTEIHDAPAAIQRLEGAARANNGPGFLS